MSTNERAAFSPEVEALLTEAASNPESLLLRVPRRPHRAWSYEPIRPTATGLTSLERHLLSAHRNEIAAYLRDETRAKLAKATTPVRITLLGVGARPTESAGTYAATVRSAISTTDAEFERELGDLSIEDLATLAQRFGPTASSTIHSGLGAYLRGDFQAAEERFTDVLRTTASAKFLSAAWSNLGLLHSRARQLDKERAAYRIAAEISPTDDVAVLCDGFCAIQYGERGRMELIEERLAGAEPDWPKGTVVAYTEELRRRRSIGLWAPTRDATALVARIDSNRGTVLRSVLDVFA